MRVTLAVLAVLATAAPLDAQIFIRYERRTKHSYLSIRVGSPTAHTHYPWTSVRNRAWGYRPPLVYTTGTLLYTPVRGVRVAPTSGPWVPLPAPTTRPSLLARVTKYVVPPAPKGPVRDLRVQSLVEAGRARMKEGEYERAVAALREAILIGPEDDARLEALFGVALAALGDRLHSDKAIASALKGTAPASALLMKDVKELFPSPQAFDKMLGALTKKGAHGALAAAFLHLSVDQKQKAEENLNAILKDEPGDPAARRLRALVD